jgi:hypothetical protein
MHRWRKWCEVRLEDGSSLPTQADCAAAVRAPGRLRGDVLLLQVLDEHCARALPGDSTIPSRVPLPVPQSELRHQQCVDLVGVYNDVAALGVWLTPGGLRGYVGVPWRG